MPGERPQDWEDAETRVVRRSETVEPPPPPPAAPPPWWRENWWIWLALLGLLVLGLVVILLVAGGDDEQPAATTTAPQQSVVPNVVGLSEDQARSELDAAGFSIEVERRQAEAPEGTVFEQEPGAGERAEPGATVVIRVAEPAPPPETVTVTETTATEPPPPPPAPATVQVPDVAGEDHLIAAAEVEQFGLVADTYPVETPEPQGTVVAQNPAAGTNLREGETVRLNVALGDAPRPDVTVPDVTGPTAAEARAACREAGLTCRTLYRAAPSQEEVGEVLDQRPAAGTVVPGLTQVTLFVGR